MIQHYRRSIIIEGKSGASYATTSPLPTKEAQSFIKLVMESLKKLEKLSTGRRLLSELDLSNHTVKIFAASDGTDSVTTAEQAGISAEIAASMRPFTTRDAILPSVSKGSPTVLSGYQQELTSVGQSLVYGAEFYTELTKALNRAKNGVPNIRAVIASKLGISQQALADFESGATAIDSETHYKLALPLYPFMTPGAGIDTAIRFEPIKKFKEDKTNFFFRPKVNELDAPAYIVLGHELIHAWRMMCGKRLVRQGWEEEAMTTGLMEFSHFPLTENMLRKEAGLPLRTNYQQGHYSSGVCGVMMLSQPVRTKKSALKGLIMVRKN